MNFYGFEINVFFMIELIFFYMFNFEKKVYWILIDFFNVYVSIIFEYFGLIYFFLYCLKCYNIFF